MKLKTQNRRRRGKVEKTESEDPEEESPKKPQSGRIRLARADLDPTIRDLNEVINSIN